MDHFIPQPLPRRCLRRMQNAARVAEGQGRADSPRLHTKAPWKLTLCLQRAWLSAAALGALAAFLGGFSGAGLVSADAEAAAATTPGQPLQLCAMARSQLHTNAVSKHLPWLLLESCSP